LLVRAKKCVRHVLLLNNLNYNLIDYIKTLTHPGIAKYY
jgi:hypothetical protein